MSGRWSGVHRPGRMGVESSCFGQLASFLRQEVTCLADAPTTLAGAGPLLPREVSSLHSCSAPPTSSSTVLLDKWMARDPAPVHLTNVHCALTVC